jgi:hypothetical protein
MRASLITAWPMRWIFEQQQSRPQERQPGISGSSVLLQWQLQLQDVERDGHLSSSSRSGCRRRRQLFLAAVCCRRRLCSCSCRLLSEMDTWMPHLLLQMQQHLPWQPCCAVALRGSHAVLWPYVAAAGQLALSCSLVLAVQLGCANAMVLLCRQWCAFASACVAI